MQREIKKCQKCFDDFIIEPDDFGFYQKMGVPAPSKCPQCRFKRRMTWRNDWHVFRKTDFLTGKKIFSLFPEESQVRIYDRDYWIGDKWEPLEYGLDYDFSKSFFEQFKILMYSVPLPSTSMINVVNCQYCTNATNIKNCYFVRGATNTEDSAYLIWDHASRGCFDSHMTNSCELSYGNVNTINCYRTFFSVDCESSQELILCKDCLGCNSCFGSVGLRNQSYYIFNQPYSKEDYHKQIIKFKLNSYLNLEKFKTKAYKHWLKFPQKYIHGRQNFNVSGDYIYGSKNTHYCFRVVDVEDSKFVQNITNGTVKDCYDYSHYGNGVELIYESLVIGTGGYNIKFSSQCYPNVKNLTYCFFCHDSTDLFGCVGLSNKKYCIFNKQYDKKTYDELMKKIIRHMLTTGEYGEFFPSNLSPFPYQISAAQEFFPIDMKQAKEQNLSWYEIEKPNYKIDILAKDLPDNINDVTKSILGKAIECADKNLCQHECTSAFRIIKTEFDFLKRVGLPLPRLCNNCRHGERLLFRNSPNLFNRLCAKCNLSLTTSYAPDRPEIVYCEQCYQREVY